MADNQLRGLSTATQEWVVLCEDDSFLLRVPGPKFIKSMEMKGIDFLCYNASVHVPRETPEKIKEYINQSESYWIYDERECVLLKHPKNLRYQIAFPGLIAKKEDMINMHLHARAKKNRKAIERALTVAWKEIYPESRVGIYLSTLGLDLRRKMSKKEEISQQDLHNSAWMEYWNNTPGLKHPSLKEGKYNKI